MVAKNALPLVIGLPTHWTSNDQNLLDIVENRLQQSSYLALRRVTCSIHNGILTLAGIVPSYYLRQIAQATIQGLAGIESIDNRLRVSSSRISEERLSE